MLYVPSRIILGAYLKIAFLRWSHPLLSKPVVMVLESWYSFLCVLYIHLVHTLLKKSFMTVLLASYWHVVWGSPLYRGGERELRYLLGRNQLSRIHGNIQWALQKRKHGWESRKERTKADMGTAGVCLEILREWERESVISKTATSLLPVKLRYCNRNRAGSNTITIII